MVAKKTQPPEGGGRAGRGLEVWPPETLPEIGAPALGRPRTSKKPTLRELEPLPFSELVRERCALLEPQTRSHLIGLALQAARVAVGDLELSAKHGPAVDMDALVRGLLGSPFGPPVSLLVDVDRMPRSPLGWLSLIVLVVGLRYDLAEGRSVGAVALAAASGRSVAHCRALLGDRRELGWAEAKVWLVQVGARGFGT